jgi:hypothetical protein
LESSKDFMRLQISQFLKRAQSPFPLHSHL